MAINCEKASLLMALYLDKEASRQDSIALESHLGVCAACRQEMALMRQMHIQLDRVKVPELCRYPQMQLSFLPAICFDPFRHFPGRLPVSGKNSAASVVYLAPEPSPGPAVCAFAA